MTYHTRKEPVPCKGPCGRMLRSSNAPAAEYPGTVPHRLDGYCKSCLTKVSENQKAGPDLPFHFEITPTSSSIPDQCVACNHPVRHYGVKLKDRPGTLRAVSGGVCSRCWDQGVRPVDPEGVRPGFDEAQARAALEAWLSRRDGHGLAA